MTCNRRQLLREKTDNLCLYLQKLFPNQLLELQKLKLQSEDTILVWIMREVLPFQSQLENLLNKLLQFNGLDINQLKSEDKAKLIKYLEFYCDVVQDN